MKSNSRMGVATYWWEAVNFASHERDPILRALRRNDRVQLVQSLLVIAAQYETWIACQDRWRRNQMSLEMQQIAEAYLAIEFNLGGLYELIDRIDRLAPYTRREVEDVLEVVKVCSSLPLFAQA